jgi:hypothetical protein
MKLRNLCSTEIETAQSQFLKHLIKPQDVLKTRSKGNEPGNFLFIKDSCMLNITDDVVS